MLWLTMGYPKLPLLAQLPLLGLLEIMSTGRDTRWRQPISELSLDLFTGLSFRYYYEVVLHTVAVVR